MIIWGKLIGATLGLIFYGPAGFILGLVFGQVFDNGLKTIFYTHKHTNNVRLVFFKTVFKVMGYLAKADGVVSEREIQIARSIMLHDFKLDKQQMLTAITFFNEGKRENFDLDSVLKEFKLVCGSYDDLRKFFLELLVKASLADKVVADAQHAILMLICNKLGIQLSELEYQLRAYGYTPKQQYNSQWQDRKNHGYNSYSGTASYNQQSDELTSAYNLLGVNPTDNVLIIKKAYRRLMSKYHPDKLVAKGLPPEMMDVAKKKTQQIAAAYAIIMRSRR